MNSREGDSRIMKVVVVVLQRRGREKLLGEVTFDHAWGK